MPITTDEAVAGMRILVAIAKADGKIDPGERASLAEALEEAPLPVGTTVEALLEGDPRFDDAVTEVKSRAGRDDVFKAAYAMANADGSFAPEEQALLEKLRAAWQIPEETAAALAKVFAEPHAADLVAVPKGEAAGRAREGDVGDDILRFSLASGLLGAFPVPVLAILADVAIVAVQLEMVREIGSHYGYGVDREMAKSMLYGLGLGTGTRIAVNNLMKLVPGWGSAFGAASSFASTWALGKVMKEYFASGGEGDTSGMRGQYDAARKEGKAAYGDHAAAVDSMRREKTGKVVALARDLESGKITRAEYEKRVAAL
jgi:uncharacterized protein (DUF697 family)/uncharacterized membrane protein YebE (DUF533 family)